MTSQHESQPTPLLPALDFCLPGTTHAVRSALAQILGALDPLDLDIEETGTVELVLAEALNNIVEHAYPSVDDSGMIWIRCTHRRDGLHLRINDEGVMMPDGQLPIGMAQNLDVDLLDLPEGGFGWFLIRDLAKDVRYQRVGQKNQLELRIAVALLQQAQDGASS